jgi:transcriptional regulator GlxA family with amidase domain
MASSEFLAFVDRCQIAVGRDRDVAAVLNDPPHLPNLAEQLVIEGLVGRLREALVARTAVTASSAHALLARRAVRWLKQHHTEALTAGGLASALGVSRWHLARVLKEQTRHGIRWHLNEARIDHAERLIRTSPLSLKEIAARAGFRSASELSRHFHLHRGLAPSALRQSVVGRLSGWPPDRKTRR